MGLNDLIWSDYNCQENTELLNEVDSLKIEVTALEKTNHQLDAKEMEYLMQVTCTITASKVLYLFSGIKVDAS